MSEIQVNKIVPESGTDVTLGDSGDTFTVPSGATMVNSGTATGFGGGKIGQVLQVVKTDTFTTTTADWIDLTDMTLAITPVATSSKILVHSEVHHGGASNAYGRIRLCKGGSVITAATGDANGSRLRTTITADGPTAGEYKNRHASMMYLDSPSTTSATTYNLEFYQAQGACYVNRSSAWTDDVYGQTTISSLTLFEILA